MMIQFLLVPKRLIPVEAFGIGKIVPLKVEGSIED